MNPSRPIVMSYLSIFLQVLNEARRHICLDNMNLGGGTSDRNQKSNERNIR